MDTTVIEQPVQTTPLQHLLRAAINAHRGTSFTPEVRGKQMVASYEELLASDLQMIKDAPAETKETYQKRFIHHLQGWMSAKSRIVSTMISGGSNFPVRRMHKYNNWERNASDKFDQYRTKALAGIKKQIQRDKPEEQKQDEAWQAIRKNILSSVASILAIDTGVTPYMTRSLFVSSITGLVKRMAANGQKEHVEKAIALIREMNAKYEKPIITEKNSIFSLVEVAEAKAETKRDLANREDKEYAFDGGTVIINYEAERVQVMFDEKPSDAELKEWKTKGLDGFNWSRTNSAWQRKITVNAIHSTNRMLGTSINTADIRY